MKKIKMAIRAVLLAGLLSCLVLGVTACKADGEQENRTGEWVITLEEAYKKKLLSKSDLREISEKFPGHKSEDNPEETLILEYGAARIEAVKKAEAENINNGISPFYSSSDSKDREPGNFNYQSLEIIGYYGTYNRCVILEMNYPVFFGQILFTTYVGGVKFSYSNTFVKVWVKD